MKFEALYLELVDSTDMIRSLLAGISQQEAQVKPNAESWSVLETLCHLVDEEREDFREHLDFIVNRPDGEWHLIDPEGWVKARKYNEQDFRQTRDRFFSERSKSLDWLKGLSDADWNKSCQAKWGTLRAGDMLASWIAHDNLAVRQFTELRRRRIEDLTQPYDVAYAGEW
jgi:hypothetical protein